MTKLNRKQENRAAAALNTTPRGSEREAALWKRVIKPEHADLSREAAESLLRLTFGDEDRRRIEELLRKNEEDALSSEEMEDLDGFLHVSFFLDLMHSKARRSLKKRGSKK